MPLASVSTLPLSVMPDLVGGAANTAGMIASDAASVIARRIEDVVMVSPVMQLACMGRTPRGASYSCDGCKDFFYCKRSCDGINRYRNNSEHEQSATAANGFPLALRRRRQINRDASSLPSSRVRLSFARG